MEYDLLMVINKMKINILYHFYMNMLIKKVIYDEKNQLFMHTLVFSISLTWICLWHLGGGRFLSRCIQAHVARGYLMKLHDVIFVSITTENRYSSLQLVHC